MSDLPKITSDMVVDLVTADEGVIKVSRLLAKIGYRVQRSRARLTRRGDLVVRVVWRRKVDGVSSSFIGAFHYGPADIKRAARHLEIVKAEDWL